MAAPDDIPDNDRCGARSRGPHPDIEPLPAGQDDALSITALGAAFMAALRAEGRYSHVLDDPFGDPTMPDDAA